MTFGDLIYSGAVDFYNFGYNVVTGNLSPYQVSAIKQSASQQVTAAGGTSDDVARSIAAIDSALSSANANGAPNAVQILVYGGIAIAVIVTLGGILKKVV